LPSSAHDDSRKGIDVVGISKHTPDQDELISRGVRIVPDLQSLIGALAQPRVIFLYVPAGPTVDLVIHSLAPTLSPGDILVDAGNSHFRDSQVRQAQLAERGIGFVDCGSRGGPAGARTGACFMVGGEERDVRTVEPILRKLAVPDGYLHAGPPGAGHFVKLIHNAIEFGMLQAIGEGVSLLKASEFPIDLPALFHNWAHGSVIRGWLVELMEKELRETSNLAEVPSYVEDTGEVNWAVEESLKLEVPIPVISAAVYELFSSRDSQEIAHKAVAILRHGFGGHPFGPNKAIALERKTGHAA
jgi:6-phosphogluconate dehydrogenase